MTVLAIYPGVLTSVSGLKPVLTTELNGFPDQGLQALYLFRENAGTTTADERGGSAGVVEHPIAVNNAYAWLPGGGIRLEGTEIVSFPQFDVTGPWTIAYAAALTGSTGGTASERVTGLIGFRDLAGGAGSSGIRGVQQAVRSGNDWNIPGAAPYYQHRVSNGAGGQLASEDMLPKVGLNLIGSHRVHVMSYDGLGFIRSAVYDKQGQLIAERSSTVTDAQLVTGTGGVIDATLQPIVGGPNNSYAGGIQQAEAVGRWNRVLTERDIQAICSAASSIGAARGRAW